MNVLIGSPDDSTLEHLGTACTDWGCVPFFVDDLSVFMATLEDPDREIYLVILDTRLMGDGDRDGVEDTLQRIRTLQQGGYIYICLLHHLDENASLIEATEIHWRNLGTDVVLHIDSPQSLLGSHIRVAQRVIRHQVEQKRVQESLWNQANHDPLTGISNRRSILRALERQAVLVQQRNQPLGLLMMDLDFFKHINDTYGHDGGDVVLKEVATRLKQCIRTSDSVGRFGGEEFLAVIPGCSGEELIRLAERIRFSMKHPISHRDLLIPISMSVGVAVHFQSESNVLDSLKRADQALYVAKEMGRDRVVCDWMLSEYDMKTG